MSDDPTFSLFVIRVSDIERSAKFYSALGLTFEREQHGNGPEHFATCVGNTVFELYPSTDKSPITTTRLGFTVVSIASVLDTWRDAGYEILSEPKDSPWGVRAVVADPDTNRIELMQKPAAGPAPQELLEVYSRDSNFAVIKPPGRHFPGAVIQGDSLSILCNTAKRIAEAVRDQKTDHEDFPYELEDLLHSLLGRLQHYQNVLHKYGVRLPFSPPVSDDDFIMLTPVNDDP